MLVLHLEFVPALRASFLILHFDDGDSLLVIDLNWTTNDCGVLLLEPIELDLLASSETLVLFMLDLAILIR